MIFLSFDGIDAGGVGVGGMTVTSPTGIPIVSGIVGVADVAKYF